MWRMIYHLGAFFTVASHRDQPEIYFTTLSHSLSMLWLTPVLACGVLTQFLLRIRERNFWRKRIAKAQVRAAARRAAPLVPGLLAYLSALP